MSDVEEIASSKEAISVLRLRVSGSPALQRLLRDRG